MPGLSRAITIVAVICAVIVGAAVAMSSKDIGIGPALWLGVAILATVAVAFVIALVVVRKMTR